MAMLHEASTMAMLNHPHIVRFVGVVEVMRPGYGPDPVPTWIVMERASTSLEGYLRRSDGSRRVLRLHEYTRLLEHVLEGLVYVHTLRPHVLVHFDPKPDNVLVFFDPHEEEVVTPVFKLGDFGSSRFLDSLGRLHSEVGVGGAVFYRAPEIGTPRVSTKSDVFSFAVMASEVLLESLEVDGAAPEVANAREMYDGLSRRHRMLEDAWSRAGLPPQLSMLLRRCGEVDPRERVDSSEALRLLRAFLVETDGRAAALERVSHCTVLVPFIATLSRSYATHFVHPCALRQTARESLEGSGGTTLVVLPSGDGFPRVGDWIVPMLATEGAIRHARSVSAMQHCAGKHLSHVLFCSVLFCSVLFCSYQNCWVLNWLRHGMPLV
jgi:serine/threonine protein kinase